VPDAPTRNAINAQLRPGAHYEGVEAAGTNWVDALVTHMTRTRDFTAGGVDGRRHRSLVPRGGQLRAFVVASLSGRGRWIEKGSAGAKAGVANAPDREMKAEIGVSVQLEGMDYTIYAVKAEQDDGALIDTVFQELRQGRARFGWSYRDSLNPRHFKARIASGGWDSLDKAEQEAIAKTAFLLDVRPGDYFVYINMPSYGRCTAVKIVDRDGVGADNILQYTPEWGSPPQHDFRNMLPCTFRFDFDRNADVVHPYLSRRLKLMGAHWTIGDKEKFEELLHDLQTGSHGKTADERLGERIEEQLLTISDRIRETYPEKNLESFVLRVLARMPRVQDAKKGPDVDGADLVFTFDGGIETLDLERTEVCAIQVKCYENVIDDTRAIDDIRRAFDSKAYTCGLIVTTAQSASERFQSALDQLREQSGKPVGLILAKDLAALFLRYGQNRSGR
jgi:hypothetical protein